MCQLLFDQPHFRLCDISTRVFAEQVREAVRRGRLLLVPGWPRIPGYASAPLSEDSRSPEIRLVRRIMKGEGHHIGNPDEYGGAKVDTTLNSDGAKNGIDPDSIMGQNLTKVKARHLRLLAKVLADAIHAEYGKTFTFDAVPP